MPYDENYGILIQAVFISMGAWVIIRTFKARWFGDFELSRVVFWSWIFIGSPATFIIGIIFYGKLFGSLAL